MTTLASAVALLAVTAIVVWFVAAFLLHWRQDGRCAATMLVPAMMATALMLRFFFDGRAIVDVGTGWSVVFVAVSLVQGALTGLVALPVWLVLEQKFGWRAR